MKSSDAFVITVNAETNRKAEAVIRTAIEAARWSTSDDHPVTGILAAVTEALRIQVPDVAPRPALRGAARPKVAPTAHIPTWTVGTDPLEGGPWSIRRDGRLVDTVASHYDVAEVLAVAEQHAGQVMAWVLVDGISCFRSVTSAEVAALAPGRVAVIPADSPEALSDADTIRQAAAGAWVVHPDIDCGTRRIMHVARGRVAIRVFCTPDGALRLATRQVCLAQGDVENTTLVSQVLVWLSTEDAL